ncbi:transposase domain-containing protein [Dactylosporangium sp. CA-233914]|uniref:transposase domain-containing protein n=1 Tax=Dactylosporangium sp. CA-233914 TaxID=3239934 RepID=UPI003D8FD8B3
MRSAPPPVRRLRRDHPSDVGTLVRPDQVTLGVLISQVPRDAVDDAVAVCGVREQRSDGKLPAHATAYLTLALACSLTMTTKRSPRR